MRLEINDPQQPHGPDRIWGGRDGRHILCVCGEDLTPSWEPVIEAVAQHVEEYNARRVGL
jgi:hypothetical protein